MTSYQSIYPPSLTLNTRHRQIIDGIGRGLTKMQIGRELGISDRTVKHYSDQARWILGVTRARMLPEALRAFDEAQV